MRVKYEDKPSQPNTINTYYNEAWATLSQYFKESQGLPHPNLCLDTGNPKTRKQWLEVMRALTTIEQIGDRQKWISRHVNRTGLFTYLIHSDRGKRE